MPEQENIMQIDNDNQKKWRASLDINIIAWFYMIVGIIVFFLGILLITGIAYTPKGYQNKILGGIITLQTNIANAIYTLILGAMNFITGYFLKKGKKIGWYLALVGSIIAMSNSILLSFSDHKISALIGILMSLVIIIWLIFRRQIYNIRISPKI